METRLSNINWEYDLELPELNSEEFNGNLSEDRYISFNYRGKELICEVNIEIDWTNECSLGSRETPPEYWEEIQSTYVTLGDITDLEENYFKLSSSEKDFIRTELANDLKTEY